MIVHPFRYYLNEGKGRLQGRLYINDWDEVYNETWDISDGLKGEPNG